MPESINPHRIRWYVVRGVGGGERREKDAAILYAGPERLQAEAARDAALALRPARYAGVALEEYWEYAPPERNDNCQCKGNAMRQMLCPTGHMTECHYPQTCVEARCVHLANYTTPPPDHQSMQDMTADEQTASWLAAGIRESDTVFHDSPDAGDPACLCSRCGKVIGEDDMPIRAWDEERRLERRFHAHCLGLHVSGESGEDDPDPGEGP